MESEMADEMNKPAVGRTSRLLFEDKARTKLWVVWEPADIHSTEDITAAVVLDDIAGETIEARDARAIERAWRLLDIIAKGRLPGGAA